METDSPSKLKLKIAYWFVSHKILIKRALFFITLLALLIPVGYGIYGFIMHYATLGQYNQMIASPGEPINYQIFRIKNQAKPLIINSAHVIKTGAGKFDLIAEVENQNEKWLIPKITYKFIAGNFTSETFEDFVLPAEKKFLVAVSQESSNIPNTAELKIINTTYLRAKASLFLDENSKSYGFDVKNSDFLVSNINFIPPGALPTKLPRVDFKITNNSIHDFWEVPIKIILFSRSSPIGVNLTVASQLKSGETRDFSIVWFDDITATVHEVIVVPDINFFDSKNYMPSTGEIGEIK